MGHCWRRRYRSGGPKPKDSRRGWTDGIQGVQIHAHPARCYRCYFGIEREGSLCEDQGHFRESTCLDQRCWYHGRWSHCGRISSVLVAGLCEYTPWIQISQFKGTDSLQESNVKATFLTCQAFIQSFDAEGTIINLVSTGAALSVPGISSYSAAKLAEMKFTRSLDLGRYPTASTSGF